MIGLLGMIYLLRTVGRRTERAERRMMRTEETPAPEEEPAINVTLYTKNGCGLCDEAEDSLRAIQKVIQFELALVYRR